MNNTNKRFIVIEGLDGTGKSTITQMLANMIEGVAIQTPDKRFSNKRKEIESKGNKTEKLQFYTWSIIQQQPYIIETLKDRHVVCDRYIHSTIAYQWPDEKIPDNIPQSFNEIIYPDFAFLLIADKKTRYCRISMRENQEGTINAADYLHDVLDVAESRFLSMSDLIRVETNMLSPEQICLRLISIMNGE